MKRQKAFKFQLILTGAQQRKMVVFSGACRWVFNEALKLQIENRENGGKFIPYVKMARWLVGWKKTLSLNWLSQPPSQALKDLERAYRNFFAGRAKFPNQHKRGKHDRFRYPQGCQLEQHNSRIFLPKIGWVRYHNSRSVAGTVKNVTISHQADKWYASIQTEYEVEPPRHSSVSMVGIDVGVVKFATLSTGEIFEPINSFQKNQRKLAKAQRVISRKVKRSRNWHKAIKRVQRLHTKVANIRRDYLHKVSTTLSKNHAMIVIEDLRVSNMSKSAKGTTDSPGRNVSAKSGLNRSILDQGWYEFRRQLEYKQFWRGGDIIAVPPQNTSRRCSECGHSAKGNRTTQSKFLCIECGYTANADWNAAQNILAAGHAVIACGEKVQSGLSMKQEPTEVI